MSKRKQKERSGDKTSITNVYLGKVAVLVSILILFAVVLVSLLDLHSSIIAELSGLLKSTICLLPLGNCTMADSKDNSWKNATSIYDFKAVDIEGNEVSLEKYKGHVCIIVNVACNCGLTINNYSQLQALYEKYSETKGLKILGFPCNQFGGQEPGAEPEIKDYIKRFNVSFDMFSKIKVNGDEAHPLFKFLKHKQGGFMGDFIKWNFTKFLIDKNGQPVKRYGPNEDAKNIEKDLDAYW